MSNSMKQAVQRALVVAGLCVAGTGLAVAHHSYTTFDMQGQKVISGTVKKFDWTNPHSWLWLEAPNEQGVMETWGIEGMSPNYLARRGWSRSTLKPGDKISVTFHPLKNGDKGGSFVSAKRDTGEVLGMTGAITDP